ncbi:hypothetical protein HL653_12640 [Sphingomonas sp. AP4-R1]|uniref:hypothetical protein n=1 Tax=Sphingomonas sp. AP4-R1 TaxID=2735134 RepID=UPI001493787D|nr:hypothetical protein [Sphingomonas sp. AP4-R1]QJU58496.1 hypothetical protein HL653_12640 [Sphingomonas sp. AP4-R1]
MVSAFIAAMAVTAFAVSPGSLDFYGMGDAPLARVGAVMPLDALAQGADRQTIRRLTLDPGEVAMPMHPLNRIWRPLPCARSGDRMTC